MEPQIHEVAIVGAGFSGIGLAIKLKREGFTDFVVLEKAHEVGGTWRENTYPGAACDVKSHLYSFSFEPNNNWTRVFSGQKEILDYLVACVDRNNLRPQIRFGWEVNQMVFDEKRQCWIITGANRTIIEARHLVLATGPLHIPNWPNIKGLAQFAGEKFHSSQWNHHYSLKGKRIAVIGTGASAIQFVPEIQPLANQLFLFQRTAPWVIPKADGTISGWRKKLYERIPLVRQAYRNSIYWVNEIQVLGFTSQRFWLRLAEKLVANHLRRHIKDEALLRKVTPIYAMGCKRILLSNNYYPALQKPNVEVVTNAIKEITPYSVVIEDGREVPVDVIICGTGFHVTDSFQFADIKGRGGRSLTEVWQNGAEAYLGTMVHGFPNMYFMIGPNTGLGHNSMVYMIESQITLILDSIHKLRAKQARALEVRLEVQEAFNRDLDKKAEGTVWNSGCMSWYLNAQGRSAAIWPDFTFRFKKLTNNANESDYIWTA
ncbi:MAG: NAD(P)/FAD-dependent oxidoreductase [Chitinophagales bacterium]